MITNLNFIRPGAKFPHTHDQDTKDRMNRYAKNKFIFEGRHAEIYDEQFKRIERVIGNFSDVVSYPVLVNYQKLISLKTADMLFSEFPKIKVGEDNTEAQAALDEIAERSDFINIAFENALDVSRFGDGLFIVYQGEEGGVIDVTQPPMWIPVVDEYNIKKTLYHVLTWCTGNDEDGYKISIHIHDKGSYEERIYHAERSIDATFTLGELISSQVVRTGLDDFAIVPVHNIKTSDKVTGYDDYMDVDSIVSEILVRVGQISKILDKHANPSMSGPSTALQKDPGTGEWTLKLGSYFPRDSKDDAEVSYLTWDSNLDSNFKQIERLVNMLYIVSEMGSILMGDTETIPNTPSGVALRMRMMSPLAKVKRLTNRYTNAIKKVFRLASQLGGYNLSNEDISITWQDGIPNNPREEAEILQIRTAGKATMSVERGLRLYDNLEGDNITEELEAINGEEAMLNPMGDVGFGNEMKGKKGDNTDVEDNE